jgi:23S rRNA pseudouridine1911/1915/1917 synthase
VLTNLGHDYEEVLGPRAEGRLLLDWLISRYPHSSAEAWRRRIEEGRVLLDDRTAVASDVLRRGQSLVWRRPAWDEPDAPTTFEILFEDEDLLAVAKPAGLPTLPGAGFLENTLLSRVRARDRDASPLHRLGRFTSGVVLFARHEAARADLSRQWSGRSVHKRYRALATGDPARDAFAVEVPIGPVPHPLLGTVHGATPAGKPSSTAVAVVERRGGVFLCDVTIATGRPHQIRIHLAAAGHPLAGDPLYGPGGTPIPGSRALPGDPGYALHAAELRFRHPRSGALVAIDCEPPEPLRRRGHGQSLTDAAISASREPCCDVEPSSNVPFCAHPDARTR